MQRPPPLGEEGGRKGNVNKTGIEQVGDLVDSSEGTLVGTMGCMHVRREGNAEREETGLGFFLPFPDSKSFFRDSKTVTFM